MVDDALIAQILIYLNSLLKSTGGFGGSVDSIASLSASYYAVSIYNILDEGIPELSALKGFIVTCANADGGYGGNENSSSTLTSTYHAISIMQIIDDFSFIIRPDLTVDYINSFFVDNKNDNNNYGGYLPDLNAKYALLSSTYYCITTLSLIKDAKFKDKNATAEWVLNRQNFQDGGFVDISDGSEQKYSSIVNSYFANEVIIALGREGLLDKEVFMLEFEWYDWLIFCSIIGGLSILAIVAVIIWRRRRI
jgi:prenyltransferase beta subunit